MGHRGLPRDGNLSRTSSSMASGINRVALSWTKLLRPFNARDIGIAVGKVAAGTAAAGAGLALGLKQLKRAQQADERLDVWKEASFDLTPRVSSARDARQVLPKIACDLAGCSAEEFWAAARRLRPVEADVQGLEEMGLAGDALAAARRTMAERWRALGYFDGVLSEPTRAELFGRRLTSDAQCVDVGVLVPPYLASFAEVLGVQPPSWEPRPTLREEAAASLRSWGCALLRGAVAPADVAALREQLGLGSGASSRRATEVGQWLLQHDPNIAMGRYTFGRLHCLLRGSPELEPQAVAVHAAIAPIVHAYFKDEELAGGRVFLSEAQLIVADPCAEGQTWHIENSSAPGLTVFVPLSNITSDRGPQELLPGTHFLSDSSLPLRERARRCLRALCATHGTVVAASPERPWAAGDALVMDGRLLHRGLSNDSLGAPAAVLVLRYDLTRAPPPGCSRWRLRAMTQLGGVLQSMFWLYAVV